MRRFPNLCCSLYSTPLCINLAIVLLTRPASLVPRHEEVQGRGRHQEEVGVYARMLLLLRLVGCAGVRLVVRGPGRESIYAYETHPPRLAPHFYVDTYILITRLCYVSFAFLA